MPSSLRALSTEKAKRAFDVNVQLPEVRVKNAAWVEPEDLRIESKIWKCDINLTVSAKY